MLQLSFLVLWSWKKVDCTGEGCRYLHSDFFCLCFHPVIVPYGRLSGLDKFHNRYVLRKVWESDLLEWFLTHWSWVMLLVVVSCTWPGVNSEKDTFRCCLAKLTFCCYLAFWCCWSWASSTKLMTSSVRGKNLKNQGWFILRFEHLVPLLSEKKLCNFHHLPLLYPGDNHHVHCPQSEELCDVNVAAHCVSLVKTLGVFVYEDQAEV